MANVERVKKAIAVMERVRDENRAFDMNWWQGRVGHNRCFDEAVPHACGTAACFAGWLAVSPEFQADGGSITLSGAPVFQGFREDDAVAAYLEVDRKIAMRLCGLLGEVEYYGVNNLHDITPRHVIDKLKELLPNG